MSSEKIQVLLVTGKVTLEHVYRKTNEMLCTLIESTGRFEVHIIEDFRGATSELLDNYDVILVNYDGKCWPTDEALRWGETAEKSMFDFVSGGKGIVFYHSSVWVDDNWPEEYVKLMGGCCSMSRGSRRNPKGDFEVKLCGGHPITDGMTAAGMESSWLTVEEDFFAGVFWHPQADV